MERDEASKQTNRELWDRLSRGEYQVAEYKRVSDDGKEIWMQASYTPILDARTHKPARIVTVATDITEHKQEAQRTQQLRTALDVCSSNMMLADAENVITYLNPAVVNFLREAEKDIQKDLPHFSVSTLIGSKMDVFHRNPAHQTDMVAKLTTTYQTAILVGGRSFNLVANPIFDAQGIRLGTVVEWVDGAATGQIEAINKSQAVIEFQTDGTIVHANENFLKAMGYGLQEIVGRHHSMFADETYRNSTEYKMFWEALNRGEAQVGEFCRYGKGAKEVWIQASYSPILDLRGKVVRVVKTATDVTRRVMASREVAKAAGSTLQNVQSVAAAAEELNATTVEIAKNMSMTRQSVDHIHSRTESAALATQKLQSASGAMDQVVQLIERIANQINLLALNATIESARAGEAGKGFAVVAGEVKSLANQTSQATAQISQEIAAMQDISNEVNTMLSAIRESVTGVQHSVTGVAGAVEEQSAATREISSNMQTAAQGVEDINRGLQGIVAG